MILYGDFVSFEITVKLLLVPLPCNGTLIKGLSPPPNTFVLNKASPNLDGGFITPMSNKSGYGPPLDWDYLDRDTTLEDLVAQVKRNFKLTGKPKFD